MLAFIVKNIVKVYIIMVHVMGSFFRGNTGEISRQRFISPMMIHYCQGYERDTYKCKRVKTHLY